MTEQEARAEFEFKIRKAALDAAVRQTPDSYGPVQTLEIAGRFEQYLRYGTYR